MYIFVLFLFFFGLSIGSFLNVLIDRLPNERSITGRSHCDHCKHKLSAADLIPIVSFFLLGARCRYCKKKLSMQYPIVELITGVMFVLIWIYLPIVGTTLGLSLQGVVLKTVYLFIISCLIVIFFADAKYRIIPDSTQAAFLLFSFILLILQGITPDLFLQRAIAAFVVMAPILFLYLITKGRGMGFGDVKLAFNMGFLLGVKSGLIALYLGFVIGGILGLILILFQVKKLKSKIAFGPFLVMGTVLMLFFTDVIFSLVNKIYGV